MLFLPSLRTHRPQLLLKTLRHGDGRRPRVVFYEPPIPSRNEFQRSSLSRALEDILALGIHPVVEPEKHVALPAFAAAAAATIPTGSARGDPGLLGPVPLRRRVAPRGDEPRSRTHARQAGHAPALLGVDGTGEADAGDGGALPEAGVPAAGRERRRAFHLEHHGWRRDGAEAGEVGLVGS